MKTRNSRIPVALAAILAASALTVSKATAQSPSPPPALTAQQQTKALGWFSGTEKQFNWACREDFRVGARRGIFPNGNTFVSQYEFSDPKNIKNVKITSWIPNSGHYIQSIVTLSDDPNNNQVRYTAPPLGLYKIDLDKNADPESILLALHETESMETIQWCHDNVWQKLRTQPSLYQKSSKQDWVEPGQDLQPIAEKDIPVYIQKYVAPKAPGPTGPSSPNAPAAPPQP
jgi:hypothetical protein